MSDVIEFPTPLETPAALSTEPHRIIQRGMLSLGPRDANVRPCNHPKLVLDDRYSTVTCEECGTKVDAFAALALFVDQWARYAAQARMLNHTHWRYLATVVRNELKKPRYTAADREALREATTWYNADSLTKLESLWRSIERHADGTRKYTPTAPEAQETDRE